MELLINPARIIRAMLYIIAVLTAMHVTQLVIYFQIDNPAIFDFIKIIDFDYETNIPSFYSSAAILFCAGLLWLIAAHKRQQHTDYQHHWLGLAIIFTFLGIDEAIAIHEDIGDLIEDQQWFDAEGFLYFSWVVPYGLLMILFAVSYLKFILMLPRKTMLLFICAGTIFISGALGIEIFGAREADLHGTETILYSILYTVEELCEMLGIVIFCHALMHYIETQEGHIHFHINSAKN